MKQFIAIALLACAPVLAATVYYPVPTPAAGPCFLPFSGRDVNVVFVREVAAGQWEDWEWTGWKNEKKGNYFGVKLLMVDRTTYEERFPALAAAEARKAEWLALVAKTCR